MLVKCPVCGAHVPADVAVEIPVDGAPQRYCSTACADEAERQAARPPAAPGPLPEPPRRLLVATDGSGPALRAVEYAATLARQSGGQVTLLHAAGGSWLQTLGMASPAAAAVRLGIRSEEITRAIEERAAAQLERARRICEQAGVPCVARVALEGPLEAVVEASREADLVVMGSRGRDALTGTVLGSLSQRVVGSAHAPVLVVH